MEGKNTTVFNKKGSNRAGFPPSSNNHQLKTKTHESQEDSHVRRKPQTKTPASRSRDGRKDARYIGIDDDNDNDDDDDDDGGGGEESDGHNESNENDADDQTDFNGAEDVEDTGNDDNIADESESESFVKTYRTYRTHIREATRREAEKEFLLNKRGLMGLPKRRKLNEQQQKERRFCTWALRQIERRIQFLRGEEADRGEASSSDGLSESDDDKRFKMYGIVAEDDTRYLVAWKGVDPKTGQAYGNEWTAKENVDEDDSREWETYKRKKANNEI
jgi:hypothetical protein